MRDAIMADDLQNTDTKLYPICVVPAERHYESCKALVDDIKWFEQSRAYCYQEYPQFKPKRGQFEKVKAEGKDGYILLPTSLDYGVLYRGQGSYYGRCLPSLYRQQMTNDELFVERVRIAEFRLFLEQFEVTQRFEQNHFLVAYVGLAQHYGLKTDVLDVTNNIDVAMFFAMCDYDRDTDSYKPKFEEKPYIGYLYAVLANNDTHNQSNPFGVYSDRLNVIGLQPFKRPGRQNGFACHVGSEGKLNGYLYSFRYTKDDSIGIFNHFRGGEYLWCKDDVVDVAKVIADTTTFSSEAVRLATRMFDATMSVSKRMKRLRQAGCTLVSHRKQPWASIRKPLTEEQWLAIQSNIVSRLFRSGEKVYPTVNTQLIGQELMFNYMYGSVDSPDDYDSGICYMEEQSRPVFGLQSSMHRDPMRPNEEDGKIHAEWYEKGNVAPRTKSFHVPETLKPRMVWVPKR